MSYFTSNDLATFQELMDEALTSWSKEATIVYPAKNVLCDDCIYDPIGKKSSNKYKEGGPMPFYHGVCPMCQGAGMSLVSVSDTIDVTVDYNLVNLKNVFEKLPSDIKIGSGFIGIRAWKTDESKIVRADYIIISGNKYKRTNFSVDVFMIVQNRYCFNILEKIQ